MNLPFVSNWFKKTPIAIIKEEQKQPQEAVAEPKDITYTNSAMDLLDKYVADYRNELDAKASELCVDMGTYVVDDVVAVMARHLLIARIESLAIIELAQKLKQELEDLKATIKKSKEQKAEEQ